MLPSRNFDENGNPVSDSVTPPVTRIRSFDKDGYDEDGYDDYGYHVTDFQPPPVIPPRNFDKDGYDEDGYDDYDYHIGDFTPSPEVTTLNAVIDLVSRGCMPEALAVCSQRLAELGVRDLQQAMGS
jgi:hypothetical protein